MVRKIELLTIAVLVSITAHSQVLVTGENDQNRVVTTAVPFLTITPDARSGAMGDVGVAISPDINAVYWNPSKLVFMENTSGFALSYTPWLSKIVPDMSISYLAGFYKPTREEAISFALKYFDMGEIYFKDQFNGSLGDFNPREYSIDAGYSRMLSEEFSIGVVLRYIDSNLTGNLTSGGTEARPGRTVAGDLGIFYTKDLMASGKENNISFGAHISNIGGKITYTDEASRDFLPAKLRLGSTFTTNIDPLNSFAFSVDFNKLLVPSPPIRDDNGNIVSGKDPDRSMLSGVFGSFSDAPDGFNEELAEVMLSMGAEYWYNNSFALRTGFFKEGEIKGDRQYMTLGLGLRYQIFGIDFAYLVPIYLNDRPQESPLAETLRFSLHLNFNNADPNKESVTDQ